VTEDVVASLDLFECALINRGAPNGILSMICIKFSAIALIFSVPGL
jgi:hypothetical protein